MLTTFATAYGQSIYGSDVYSATENTGTQITTPEQTTPTTSQSPQENTLPATGTSITASLVGGSLLIIIALVVLVTSLRSKRHNKA